MTRNRATLERHLPKLQWVNDKYAIIDYYGGTFFLIQSDATCKLYHRTTHAFLTEVSGKPENALDWLVQNY